MAIFTHEPSSDLFTTALILWGILLIAHAFSTALHERFGYVVAIAIFLSMVIGHHEDMETSASFFCIAPWLIHIGLVSILLANRIFGRNDSDDSATLEKFRRGEKEVALV
jgi:uncharacterized membrane protein HdeD (DUF308 family)